MKKKFNPLILGMLCTVLSTHAFAETVTPPIAISMTTTSAGAGIFIYQVPLAAAGAGFSALTSLVLLLEYATAPKEQKDNTMGLTLTRESHGLTLHSSQASSGYEKGKEEGKVSLDSESLRQAVQMAREDAKNLLTTGESSALLEETIHSLRLAAESRGIKEVFDRFSDRELAEALTIVELI